MRGASFIKGTIFLFCIIVFSLPINPAVGAGSCVTNQPIVALVYDDGSAERGGVQQLENDAVALKFTPTVYPFYVQRVAVNIVNYGGNPEDELELRIYGEATTGGPGRLLLDGLKFHGVPLRYEENIWVDVDISAYNIVIDSGSFYAAVVWQNSNWSPGLGIDVAAPNELRTWVCEGGDWSLLSQKYPWAYDDQAMIRAFGSEYSTSPPLLLQRLYYDDGSAEKGGIQQVVGDGVALRVTPPTYPFSIQSISVDIVNFGGNPADPLELRIYGDNNGAPGDLVLGGITFSGTPTRFEGNSWVDIDLSSYNLVINKGDFYVTVIWKTQWSPGLGIDQSYPNELRTWVLEGGQWDLLGNKYPWAYSDQAMIHVMGNFFSSIPLNAVSYDDGDSEGGSYQALGDAVALRFAPAIYPYYLKNVAVAVLGCDWAPSTNPLKLQIYDEYNGLPGALLLDDVLFSAPPVPTAIPGTTGDTVWTSIDLSTYGIVISDGNFYVAVEWTTQWEGPLVANDHHLPRVSPVWVRLGGQWSQSGLNADDQPMIRAYGTITDSLSQICLCSPSNGAVFTSPPTFSWAADAGSNNAYSVEASLSPGFKSSRSTYQNLNQIIHETSWTMPLSVWSKLPLNKPIYWRVRGTNMDAPFKEVITSDESRYFMKNGPAVR